MRSLGRDGEWKWADGFPWLYLVWGLAAGAAVIVYALLPSESVVPHLVLFAAMVPAGMFIVRRITNVPASTSRYRWKIAWLVAVGVLMFGGIFLAGTVGHRGGAFWLSCVAAILLLLVVSSGAWFVDGDLLHEAAADPELPPPLAG
ncbi:hypothetical protein [Glaciibacter flavus]|uniref:hypothetical protein n=1 Tax=Orlajensenia flava TaxID=2565934 RepID=UPI003B00A234